MSPLVIVVVIILIVIVVVVGSLFLRMRSTTQHFDRFLASEHLTEFARGIATITRAAHNLRNQQPGPAQDNDPRILHTSAGISVFYTITEIEEGFLHHYSISDTARGYTPNAIGGTLAIYTAVLLGVEPQMVRFERSQRSVYHAEFGIASESQDDLVGTPLHIPTPTEAHDLVMRCMMYREQVTFHPLELDPAAVDAIRSGLQ